MFVNYFKLSFHKKSRLFHFKLFVLFGLFFNSNVNSQTDKEIAFPPFTWDTPSTAMHFKKISSLMTHEERVAMLRLSNMIVLEKTHGLNDNSNPLNDKCTDWAIEEEAQAIKAIDPKAKVLFYFNCRLAYPFYEDSNTFLNNKDTWALKDKNDNFIVKQIKFAGNDKNIYAFDLSKLAVRNWWIKAVRTAVVNGNSDGVFMDAAIAYSSYKSKLTTQKYTALLQGLRDLFRELKAEIGSNKIVIYNGIRSGMELSGDFSSNSNAVMIEHFNHFQRQDKEDILFDINGIADAGQAGNMVVCKSWPGPTGDWTVESFSNKSLAQKQSQARRYFEFNLAAFLMGAQKHSRLIYNWGYSFEDGALEKYDLFDMPLGAPKTPGYQKIGGSDYNLKREFEHASVSVDLNNKTSDIFWHKQWLNSGGAIDNDKMIFSKTTPNLTFVPLANDPIGDAPCSKFKNDGDNKGVVFEIVPITDSRVLDNMRIKVNVIMRGNTTPQTWESKIKFEFSHSKNTNKGKVSFNKTISNTNVWQTIEFDFRNESSLMGYDRINVSFASGRESVFNFFLGEVKGVDLDLSKGESLLDSNNGIAMLETLVESKGTLAEGVQNPFLPGHESESVSRFRIDNVGVNYIKYKLPTNKGIDANGLKVFNLKMYVPKGNSDGNNKLKLILRNMNSGTENQAVLNLAVDPSKKGTWQNYKFNMSSFGSGVPYYDQVLLFFPKDNSSNSNKYYFDSFTGPSLINTNTASNGANLIRKTELKVFPNPFVDSFSLSENVESIDVYSLTGVLVSSFKGNRDLNTQYDMSNLQKGMYLLQVYFEDGNNEVFQIIKK